MRSKSVRVGFKGKTLTAIEVVDAFNQRSLLQFSQFVANEQEMVQQVVRGRLQMGATSAFGAGVTVPDALVERMRKTTSAEAAFAEGVAIAREIVTAVKGMAAGVQISTPSGRLDAALDVLDVV